MGTMEVMVGAVISMIVLFAVMSFFDAQQKAFATMNAYSRSQNVTRSAAELIARDIRMSSYDPTGLAMAPLSPGPTCGGVVQGLVQARPNSIRIRQDLNADGLLVTPGEDVLYFISGNELRRLDVPTVTVATLTTGLATNGLRFRYFDNQVPPAELVPAGSPPELTATQRACVQKVQVEIEASIPRPVANGTPLRSVVETGVAIRNRSLQMF